MGIPGSDTHAMKAIIKAQQSEMEKLPELLRNVRDMIHVVTKHVPGESQSLRDAELRGYIGQKSMFRSAEGMPPVVTSDTLEVDSDDEDRSEELTEGYVPGDVSRYLRMTTSLGYSVKEPE